VSKPLVILAAGSLAGALCALTPVFGHAVTTEFGPSGLLRPRIEGGADWDVFVSADTGHPARLHAAGLGTAPRVFCRNALALIVRPGLPGDDVMSLLTRADLRLGISTPGNDPSGDYALAALDRLGPGVCTRALRLTGAPDLPQAPVGRNPYAWTLETGAADLFVTYRTNAVAARHDSPRLRALDLPAPLQIRATYALTTRIGAGPGAEALARRLLSPDTQDRLAALGFSPLTQFQTAGDIA
jgi:molybdenum ABC transporter molybdate-binding protein